MGDANVLAVSLGDLEQTGWNLDDYLTTRKDLSDSVVVGLLAANRVRREPRPVPSDAFRRRARSSFVSLVQEQAVSRLTSSRPTLVQRFVGYWLVRSWARWPRLSSRRQAAELA